MLRKIVRIDEARCDGCGQCIPSCAEGAIALVGGKARLSSDVLCDGLGACLGECPQGAISVVEREAAAFDERAVEAHLTAARAAAGPAAGPSPFTRPPDGARDHLAAAPPAQAAPAPSAAAPALASASASGSGSARPRLAVLGHSASPEAGGCPGARPTALPRAGTAAPVPIPAPGAPGAGPAAGGSRLGHWPVQLHLVPPTAPWLRGADLLVAADCVPFAYPRFHEDLLAGRALVVGCPKLDDLGAYVEKLARIFEANDLRSVTVVRMEVPCCGGISVAARRSLGAAARDVPLRDVVVGVDGAIRS